MPTVALPAQSTSPSAAADTKVEKKPTDDEPQNELTKKFTESEWKGVQELRKKLPEIFEKAYEKPEAKTTPITLWGVHIDPKEPRDAKVSVVLAKFLRARNLNVNEAEKMLVATLRWREEFKVEECVKEEYPKEVFGNLGHVYGKDKEGRPVVYNLYGANKDTKAVFGDVQRFLRWRVALMEKSVSYLDFETIDQTDQIHDYEGVSLSQRDANSKSAASEATSIFQNHYPEFLSRKFFINIPTLLTWIFWVFKPVLSAATFAKMTVVGTGHDAIAKALLPIIDKTELPKKYGGEADGF